MKRVETTLKHFREISNSICTVSLNYNLNTIGKLLIKLKLAMSVQIVKILHIKHFCFVQKLPFLALFIVFLQ